MDNLKKIAPVIAVVALVIVIAVVIITNWGKWTKNLVNAGGNAIGLKGAGKILDGIDDGGTTVDVDITE